MRATLQRVSLLLDQESEPLDSTCVNVNVSKRRLWRCHCPLDDVKRLHLRPASIPEGQREGEGGHSRSFSRPQDEVCPSFLPYI